MKKYSLTYLGIIIALVCLILQKLGINVIEGNIEITVTTIGQIVGAIIALIGRYRKGGINILGLKK